MTTKYAAICADPPWQWVARSPKGEGRSASQHYHTMTLAEISALPVQDLASDDCALFMWAIDSMLPQALDLIGSWGFTFKTVAFYWTKLNRDGSPFMGTGYWTRANPEVCLLATRGSPRRLSRSVRRWVSTPRREHSRKPDEAYDGIRRLVGGPYVELFARSRREGWDQAFSDESDKFAAAAE